MKYYYSFFRDTNTEVDPEGQLYKVVIKTVKGEGMEELLLSGSPFTVNYDAGDDLYKPIKGSTATVGILNKDLDLNLNPEDIQDVEVNLLKLNPNEKYSDDLKNRASDTKYFTTEWSGYATPNAYSQGYNSYYDEFQLECQDKLSIIKYISTEMIYTQIPNSLSILTFNTLLHYLIDFLRLDRIYASSNIKTQYGTFFNLAVSNRLIFLDNGEFRPIIDCIESVLKALNLTAIQHGNSIYIINYDAISTEYSTYNYIKNMLIDINIYEAEVRNVLDLKELKSSGNGTNISIEENKTDFYVNVNNEENTFIIEDLKNNETLSTREDVKSWRGILDTFIPTSGGNMWTYNTHTNEGLPTPKDVFTRFFSYFTRSGESKPRDFVYTIIEKLKLKAEKQLNEIKVNLFAYNQQGVKINSYDGDFKLVSELDSEVSTNKNIFAAPIIYASEALKSNTLSTLSINQLVSKTKKYGFMIYHPYIDGNNNPIYNYDGITASQSYINSYKNKDFVAKFECMRLITPRLVLKSDEALRFSYNVEFFADYCKIHPDSGIYFYPDEAQQINKLHLAIQFVDDNGSVFLYKGLGNGYSLKPNILTSFTGNDLMEVSISRTVGEDFFNTTYSIMDDNSFSDDKYLTIESPTSSVGDPNYYKTGYFVISIFRPFGCTSQAKTFSTLISDIKLSLISNKQGELYTLNDEYTSDNSSNKEVSYNKKGSFYKDDIKEEINISTTDYSDCTQLNTLLTTRDGFLNTYDREVDLIYNLATGNICTPMELVINAYKNQYLTPTLVLNTQVHNDSKLNMLSKITYGRFPDKSFIVNSMSIDYAYNSCDVQLIEKK